MAIVTINGQIGAGVAVTGLEVTRLLGSQYVDQTILSEAAQRLGATIQAVAQKDQRPSRLSERLSRFFRNFLEQSATVGSAGDPFLGPTGIEVILARPYPEAAKPAITTAQELDDQRLITVMNAVIHDLGHMGDVVIVGRASNVILSDEPRAVHVNLTAPLEPRVKFIMDRDRLDQVEAEKFVREYESNRTAYFRKFYKVDANDPSHFQIVINTGRLTHAQAAKIIATTVREQEANSFAR